MEEEKAQDTDSSPEDPGPAPFFMFLPQKILQIKMILKAASTVDPDKDFKRTSSFNVTDRRLKEAD